MTQTEELFEPIQTSRVSDSTIDQIISLITAGKLKPGDQLPGERTLIKRLGVGRTSLREALRALEAMGIIEVRPGVGSFVKKPPPSLDMSSEWVPWLVKHEHEIMELVELREALETRVAYFAATRADEAQREAIRVTLVEMAEAIEAGDNEAVVAADKAFHEALADASHNTLIAEVLGLANDALTETREAILSLPGRPVKSLAEHQLIWEAIEARDATGAERAALKHIEGVAAEVQRVSSTSDEE